MGCVRRGRARAVLRHQCMACLLNVDLCQLYCSREEGDMTTWVMIIIFQTQTANGAISATNIPGFASVQECFEAKNSISGVPGITESWRVSAYCIPGPRK
jgi:hypothetical protein